MQYRIKEISDISGVSIRMLRYYDKKGLLQPEGRTENGYRYYSEKDLERLQRILFLRELDFSIEEIGTILEGTKEDITSALASQERLLEQKINRLKRIQKSIRWEINNRKEPENKMSKERFKEFDMSEIERHKKEYAEEARQKYGKTEAYGQSRKRTDGYKEEDWKRIQSEADVIYRKLAGLMDRDVHEQEVVAAIAEWREHINSHFYECTDEIFSGLADIYVSDARFTKNIDKYGPGLAEFMSKAMKAGL